MKKLYFFKKAMALWGMMAFAVMTASATDIHVATTGSDDNPGTESAPLLTIHKAVELVKAGDRILIHEGTYTISERIKIPALPTNPDLRCEMRAYPDDAVGKVIIDGSAMHHTTESAFKMGRCIYVNHLANCTPTGISVVSSSTADKTQKVILNGRLVILKNGVRYNAQGQIIK